MIACDIIISIVLQTKFSLMGILPTLCDYFQGLVYLCWIGDVRESCVAGDHGSNVSEGKGSKETKRRKRYRSVLDYASCVREERVINIVTLSISFLTSFSEDSIDDTLNTN